MTSILQDLYKAFMESDASLAEINPLVLTPQGILLAIDAKMVFDDAKGLSYVRMDGNIGCMVNGAGLAMTTMDMIKLYGGSPANFLDIGGSSNPVKVIEAMKLLLNDSKVKAVFINIFGGIPRCDDVAIGLIQAFDQLQTEIPVIVRLTGTNENIGRKLLKDSNRFQVAETMNEATLMAVKSVKGEIL